MDKGWLSAMSGRAVARLQYKVERDGYDSVSDKTRIGETGGGSGKTTV